MLVGFAGKEIRANEIHAAGRNQNTTDFMLSVSGKIERRYRGTLDIKIVDGVLVPVVTMDLETAVASVVYAESLASTPIEALKAQAVVTRSYFVAAVGRHKEFDFCDLTHCQFLREAPPRESPASLAAEATRDLVITFERETRSCDVHAQLRRPHSHACGYWHFFWGVSVFFCRFATFVTKIPCAGREESRRRMPLFSRITMKATGWQSAGDSAGTRCRVTTSRCAKAGPKSFSKALGKATAWDSANVARGPWRSKAPIFAKLLTTIFPTRISATFRHLPRNIAGTSEAG